MDSYLDNYIGEWDDECDHRLSITRVDGQTAFVSFFVNNQAISRPWFEDKLSTKMKARYEYDEGGLVVELWESGKEFSLHLNFEPEYDLDKQNRDSLSVALSRFEKDGFLDQYYCLFGSLTHYVRVTARKVC